MRHGYSRSMRLRVGGGSQLKSVSGGWRGQKTIRAADATASDTRNSEPEQETPACSVTAARPESWRAAGPLNRTTAADDQHKCWRSMQHWMCVLTRHQQLRREARSRDLPAIPVWKLSATSSDLHSLRGSPRTGRRIRHRLALRFLHRSRRQLDVCNCTGVPPAIVAVLWLEDRSRAPKNDRGERNIPPRREKSR